jgi:hypothetical protein
MWELISYAASIITALIVGPTVWKIYNPTQPSADNLVKTLIKRFMLSLSVSCVFGVVVYKSLNPEKKEPAKPQQNQPIKESKKPSNSHLESIKEPNGSLKFFIDTCDGNNNDLL